MTHHEDALERYRRLGREALAQTCLSIKNLPEEQRSVCKAMKNGTTIEAHIFAGADGSHPAIIACDGQTTIGYEKYMVNTDKIGLLDGHSAMASCGYAAPSMVAAKALQAIFRMAKVGDKKELTAKGKAQEVNNLVGEYFSYADYFFLPIFVAWDEAQRRARLWDIWGSKGCQEWPNFFANGCGSDFAWSELKFWTPDLTEDQAIDLAVRAIHAASHKTCGANQPQYVRIVGESGIEDVPREIIQVKLNAVRASCLLCKWEQEGGVV